MRIEVKEMGGLMDASLCTQLAAYGLTITDTSAIYRNFAYNAPVVIGKDILLQCSKLGAYTYFAPHARLDIGSVGAYSTISSYCDIGLSGHDLGAFTTNNAINANTVFDFATPELKNKRKSSWLLQNQGEFLLPITIGNDVYLEHKVVIPKGGITIGDGAIIRANTIVTKDIPPYAIVANGARGSQVVGYRFKEEIIADLLELKWWEYDLPSLLKQGFEVPLFDIAAFMEFMREARRLNYPRIAERWRYLMRDNKQNVVLYDVTPDCQMPILFPKELNEQTVAQARAEVTRQEHYQLQLQQQNIVGQLNGSEGITLQAQ